MKIPIYSRLSISDTSSHSDSGYSGGGRDSVASAVAYNPDLQSSVPQIMHTLGQVQSSQQHILHLWQVKKTKLEQCFQLRVFEQDCEKMFDWIYQNREAFLSNYVDIGNSYSRATTLQEDHRMRSQNTTVRITNTSIYHIIIINFLFQDCQHECQSNP